jgi:hypothetical protein
MAKCEQRAEPERGTACLYVFIEDVSLLRERVIKIQTKIAVQSTSILLCAIK